MKEVEKVYVAGHGFVETNESEALEARVAAADALADAVKTGVDYASDAAEGMLWYETTKDGAKVLVQIKAKQGKEDLVRFNDALAAYQATKEGKTYE